MFVGLTGTKRLKARWIVALAYLFCVLAPTLSFALPGSHASAHCPTGDDCLANPAYEHKKGIAQHVHNGQVYGHSSVQAQVCAAGDHHAKPVALGDDLIPAEVPHPSDGECCGSMCMTAFPAMNVGVAKPSMLGAIRLSESPRRLTGNAPPRLYRPPTT